MITDCDFCRELIDDPRTRFGEIYANHLPNRIIRRTERFVVMPTIGQLFEGSLLLLPTGHVETFASLSVTAREEAVQLLDVVSKSLGIYGHPIMFEHGARCTTGGGCGIYHAHLHLVPVPTALRCGDLSAPLNERAPSIDAAWEQLRFADEYLLLRDSPGEVAFALGGRSNGTFRSQFFRRALAEHYQLPQSWDWRTYKSPERSLMSAYGTLSACTENQ